MEEHIDPKKIKPKLFQRKIQEIAKCDWNYAQLKVGSKNWNYVQRWSEIIYWFLNLSIIKWLKALKTFAKSQCFEKFFFKHFVLCFFAGYQFESRYCFVSVHGVVLPTGCKILMLLIYAYIFAYIRTHTQNVSNNSNCFNSLQTQMSCFHIIRCHDQKYYLKMMTIIQFYEYLLSLFHRYNRKIQCSNMRHFINLKEITARL